MLRDSVEKRTALERVSSERKASRSASSEKGSSRTTDPDYMNKIDEAIHEYRDDFDSTVLSPDPTDSTKMMDSGGAVIDHRDESLGKKTLIPSQPNAKDTDTDVPQDLQNQRAIDFNLHKGGNPFKISTEEMRRAEERERLANC